MQKKEPERASIRGTRISGIHREKPRYTRHGSLDSSRVRFKKQETRNAAILCNSSIFSNATIPVSAFRVNLRRDAVTAYDAIRDAIVKSVALTN